MGASLATGRCVWAQNGWSIHKRCFGAGHLVVNVKVRVWCQEKHYVFKLLTSTEVESWGGGERSRPPLSQIAAPFVTGSNVTGSKVLRAWHSDMLNTSVRDTPAYKSIYCTSSVMYLKMPLHILHISFFIANCTVDSLNDYWQVIDIRMIKKSFLSRVQAPTCFPFRGPVRPLLLQYITFIRLFLCFPASLTPHPVNVTGILSAGVNCDFTEGFLKYPYHDLWSFFF